MVSTVVKSRKGLLRDSASIADASTKNSKEEDMRQRPSKDKYYLNIALAVAQRGTCLRRNYGAVIVNDDQIVGTGYTGTPRGEPNCIDVGSCSREEANIPSGERYDLCLSVHAEMNAMIHTARRDVIGSTLYVAEFNMDTDVEVRGMFPCYLCARMIKNAGIERVVITGENEDTAWMLVG